MNQREDSEPIHVRDGRGYATVQRVVNVKSTGVFIAVGLLAAAVTACGSERKGADDAKPAPTVTVTVTPSASPTPMAPQTAGQMARALVAKAGVAKAKVVDYTEHNDPNGIIGTPSGYQAGSLIHDPHLKCEKPDNGLSNFGIDCGVVIEEWPDAAGAIKRGAYLQSLAGTGLAATNEWDFTSGTLLIRVSGSLRPSQANPWRTAAASLGAVSTN